MKGSITNDYFEIDNRECGGGNSHRSTQTCPRTCQNARYTTLQKGIFRGDWLHMDISERVAEFLRGWPIAKKRLEEIVREVPEEYKEGPG